MYFDSYTKDAPHDSDRWAHSDRGWLIETFDGIDSIGIPYSGDRTVGNYLDYGPDHHRYDRPDEIGNVHAIYHGRIEDSRKDPEFWQPGPTRSRYLPTVDAAKAWLVEQHNGQRSLL